MWNNEHEQLASLFNNIFKMACDFLPFHFTFVFPCFNADQTCILSCLDLGVKLWLTTWHVFPTTSVWHHQFFHCKQHKVKVFSLCAITNFAHCISDHPIDLLNIHHLQCTNKVEHSRTLSMIWNVVTFINCLWNQ
jgi:hypothetical protein